MTQEPIEDYARRAGVNLTGIRVYVASSADDVRYFDYMETSASTELGHIALAPSTFADEQARNLMHERGHIDQHVQGRVGTGVTRSWKTRHTPPMMRSGTAISLGRNENK